MRSNGLATVLLMIPVLTVPALAIFGVPQFAPVVASPLDEETESDRDTRGGNSSRRSSRDELFGDIDEMGSDLDSQDEPAPKKRKSSLSSASNRAKTRAKEKDAGSWSDDLSSTSDGPGKRRPAAINSDDPADQDSPPPPPAKSSKKFAALEKSSKDKLRSSATTKGDEPIRLVSATDADRSMPPSGFDDDNSQELPRANPRDERARSGDHRRGKRKDAGGEALSWTTAVERLNQLDIRNFRLEPGHELGQFVFICVYTPPENPSVTHRFEAEAEQPLKAVENVLDQIHDWQQRR